jgi:hypothetical protein
MVAFSAGMVFFFVLSIVLTRMLDQGRAAERFMVVMAVVFAVLLVVTLYAESGP